MEGRQVQFHPDALDELLAAHDWYEQRSPQAASAFVSELERAIENITQSPRRWPLGIAGTRRLLLKRFLFSVVYREKDALIEVVAIAHGRAAQDIGARAERMAPTIAPVAQA